MNILLWFLQVIVAFFCLAGSAWRIFNYEQASADIPSLQALPYGVWVAIGLFEIICALGLIIPAAFKIRPQLTAVAASALAIEMLLITFHHSRYFGLEAQASNPAMWTIFLAVLSAFIAYGRSKLKPIVA